MTDVLEVQDDQDYEVEVEMGEPWVKHEFPAGAYYIGDPCYVLSDDHYDEWGDQCGDNGGLCTIDGVTFLAARTGLGDFLYGDGLLDVDSGTLAIIPVALVAKVPNNGAIFRRFYEPFTVAVDDNQTIDFGGWIVDTGGAEMHAFLDRRRAQADAGNRE